MSEWTTDDLALLYRVQAFLQNETELRAYNGMPESDYERAPTQLANELAVLLSRIHGGENG
jgi:hypothetical protein